MKSLRPLLILSALATLASVQPAAARNVAIVHPVAPVLNGKTGRNLVSDLRVAFGGATAGSGTAITTGFEVEGIGGSDYIGNRRPTDAEVCDRALIDALTKLVLAARNAGANAIVGIVSNYQHHSFDDPNNVECHAGTFKSHVVLKANFVRLDAAAPAAPAALALAHAHAVPPASGFADINDATAVPISAEGQARYRHYLMLPAPKAFTVNADGGWRIYSKDAEAMSKALDYCARQGKTCWLYAVDDRVVWTTDPATRISQSRQLLPR
jgi:uncharacterized protein YbjQ (UPF0145 family)